VKQATFLTTRTPKSEVNVAVLDCDWMKVLMHALAASCEELRARTGNPPLVIGTVYHPPSADAPAMLDYLSSCLSALESRFSNVDLLSWVTSID
jgi:hypothetical protein